MPLTRMIRRQKRRRADLTRVQPDVIVDLGHGPSVCSERRNRL